jgi:hypothetical protein
MQSQTPSASGATDELRSDAKQIGASAANRLHSEIDAGKGTAAEQAKSVSSAIERAGGELNDAPQWLKSAFEQGARQVQRFADTLENKDSRQIVDDVTTFARDNPGTFLAGCAAAGFAAARIFKAGGSSTHSANAGELNYGAQPPAVASNPMQSGQSPRGEFV